jgi:NADH:ubiquinone oxidoreductase subunit 5 (subunit L)/multisubunit Na+/H+ antiporter MnhA subunit
MFRVVFIAFFAGPGPVPVAAKGRAVARGAHGQGSAAGAHGGGGHLHDPPAVMALPLWLLALLSVGIGVFFTVHHPPAEFHSPGWLQPLAIAVAVAGIALAWATYQLRAIDSERLAAAVGPLRAAAHAGFWIDAVFLAIYRGVLLGFSRAIGWLDRYIVDGVVNLLSAWTLEAGDRLRRIQSGQPQDYVYGVAFGLLLLIVWIQWPR